MKTNDILAEIRRTRDDLAQEAGYDLQRLFEYVRQREREAAARGVKFVSHAEDEPRELGVVLRGGAAETVMNAGNEILDEIRRTRDALVRDCGGDLRRLGDHLRVVSFAGQPTRELPPTDWEKIDAEPEDEIMTEIRATRRKLMKERELESFVVREEPPEK